MLETCGTCKWAKPVTRDEIKEEWPLYCDRDSKPGNFSLRAMDGVGNHPCYPTLLIKPEHGCAEWCGKEEAQ